MYLGIGGLFTTRDVGQVFTMRVQHKRGHSCPSPCYKAALSQRYIDPDLGNAKTSATRQSRPTAASGVEM